MTDATVAVQEQGSRREPVVELRRIGKNFDRTRALSELSLGVAPGEVLGVVGDNGAGKSTLLRTIGGVYRPDEGELHIGGAEQHNLTPVIAQRLGVEIIHQNLGLIDTLNVVSNLFLNREIAHPSLVGRTIGWLDRGAMTKEAGEALGRFGLPESVLKRSARQLSGGQRQMVAVARAVHWNPKIVLMDEPTAALAVEQARRVLDLIRTLANSGIAILFVSHDIGHVLEVTDRVIVLRHGTKVADLKSDETSHAEIVMYMTGHALEPNSDR
jgi:ABC-type sugar transport system ATPase subunit